MAVIKVNGVEFTEVPIASDALVQFYGIGDILVADSATPADGDWFTLSGGDLLATKANLYVKAHRGHVVVLDV